MVGVLFLTGNECGSNRRTPGEPEDHAPGTRHHVIPSVTKDKYCCNKSEATEWQEVATETFYGGIRDPHTVRHRDT